MKKFFRRFLLLTVVTLSFRVMPVFASELANPLGEKGPKTPNEVIANVIKGFLGVVGGITLLIFIYGGFMWLISSGRPDYLKKGRETLTWAVIGLVVIFGSYTIAKTIFAALG